MKFLLTSLLCMLLLFGATNRLEAMNGCCNSTATTTTFNGCCDCRCRSIFIPRSQGDDLVRQATYKNYNYDEECFYGDFSIDYRYQRSRHGWNIARSLFGAPTVTFQGSNIINATGGNPAALMADNFGLSPNTNNTIGFCPSIQNNIADFELYLGLNEWWDGLFFQLNAPLANSKWRLNPSNAGTPTAPISQCCNNNNNNGCCNGPNLPTPDMTSFNPGCMNTIATAGTVYTGVGTAFPTTIPTTNTASAPSYISALGGNFLFGDMQTPWNYGKFNFCACDDTRLAAVNLILGYYFYECRDYHFGVFLRASAPTGTEIDCCAVSNFFSPIIGQNHWGLGAGLTGHAELFNCDDEHFINVYFEGYVEHLFERCQSRSFDFLNKGCLSRYMLLKSFTSTNNINSYNNNLINGINYATRRVQTSVGAAGEGILEFVYSNACGFSASLGYNIYGNSHEKGCRIGMSCNTAVNSLILGFKGCAPINAYDLGIANTGGVVTVSSAFPANTTVQVTLVQLNATQSGATINGCVGAPIDNAEILNNGLPAPSMTASLNLNTCSLNNATTAITGGAGVGAINTTTGAVVITPTVGAAATEFVAFDSAKGGTYTNGQLGGYTSNPATFLGSDASLLDIRSGLVGSQVTNKVFGHVDYEWADCDWTPYLYIGGEAEFASRQQCSGMSAWAIFIGGGVGF